MCHPGPYLVPQMAADAAAVLGAAGGGERARLWHLAGQHLRPGTGPEPASPGSLPGAGRILRARTLDRAGRARALRGRDAAAQPAPEEGARVMLPFTYDPGTPAERIEEDMAVRLAHYPTPDGYAAQVAWVGTYESESRVGTINVPDPGLAGRFGPLRCPRERAHPGRADPGRKAPADPPREPRDGHRPA